MSIIAQKKLTVLKPFFTLLLYSYTLEQIKMKIILALTLIITLSLSVPLSYAQSNTERLNSLVTMAESMTETLQEIVSSIAELPTQIENLLSATNAKIDAGFNSTSMGLDGIRTDVESVDSKLDTVSVTTSAIGSQVAAFEASLGTLLINSEATKSTLNDVTALMTALSGNIDTVRTEIAAQDIAALSNSIDSLKLSVNTDMNTINTRLTAIEASLRDLAEKPSDSTLGLSDSPIKSSTKVEITSYTYKQENRPIGNTYELDFAFLCNGPIVIDEVSTDVRRTTSPIIPTPDPTAITPVNYLRVDGENLYHSRYESTPGLFVPIIASETYEGQIKQLAAGEKLRFTSVQHESGSIIADSSLSNFGFKYIVTVNYIKSAATTCSFDIAQGVSLPKRDSAIIVASTTNPPLNAFQNVLTCGGNPVEIQDIRMVAQPVTQSLASFAELNLFFEGASDSTADVTIGIVQATGELEDHTYPLRFDGDLKLAGNVPGTTVAIITIDYATVSGGSCEQQQN